MQYALIKDGIVRNVIVAEPDFLQHIAAEWEHIEALDTEGELALNVGIGWGWDGSAFIEPPAQPMEPAPADPAQWLIDIGPFFDRFGPAKMAVLTSTDPGVRAILSDLQVRKWIDLQRADVTQGLQYVGSVVPAVTAALQTSILTTPVAEVENLALRRLYFPGS